MGPTSQRRDFALSFNPLMRVLMMPLLAGPRRCRVVLTDDRLVVGMGIAGWAFSSSVPRSSIVQVKRVKGPVWAWGAHGWRGRWLINGSSRGLVQITVQPPARGRCLGVPLRVRELTLSLERPDELVTALS